MLRVPSEGQPTTQLVVNPDELCYYIPPRSTLQSMQGNNKCHMPYDATILPQTLYNKYCTGFSTLSFLTDSVSDPSDYNPTVSDSTTPPNTNIPTFPAL